MTIQHTDDKATIGKKIISLLLVLTLLITGIQTDASASSATNYSFGRVSIGGLNVRNSVGGQTLIQLDRNIVVQVLQTLTDSNSVNWLAIYYSPTSTTGYVQASYITLMSQTESNAYAASNPGAISPTSITSSVNGVNPNDILGYVETIASGVNLREKANGGVIGKIDRAQTFPYTKKETAGGYNWFRVYSQQYGFGYLRADFVKETAITSSTLPSVPVAPAPSTFGSITMTTDKVNVRATAAQHGTRIGKVFINTVLILLEAPVQNQGYTWYKISANGVTGYVRGDMARFNNDASGAPPSISNQPGQPAPTALSGFGHVVTSVPSVALRNGPSDTALTLSTVGINQQFSLTGIPIQSGFYTWYPVVVNGVAGYFRNDTVQYFPAGSVNPSLPAPTNQGGTPTNNLITVMDKVNLRVSPAFGTKAPYRVALGTVFPYSRTTTVSGKLWYKILHNNTELWVLGTMVRVLGSNENPGVTAPPGGTTPPQTSNFIVTTKRSVKFRKSPAGSTLSTIPSKGTVLPMLSSTTTKNYTWYQVTYNNRTGYVRGDVVSVSDNNGNIISPPTTTPPGGGNNNSTFQLYRPVRKEDWNNGNINRIWPRGTSMPVMDVRTGKSFMMYRWAGGSHVDGEPLTKADTAILCSIYGVSKASQITSNKHYHRRPMWVTINGVTYAASLYGVPHNPAGNAIKNNDYDGQMCLHFLNSRLHSSNKVDSGHMAAVEEAFQKGK